jgi:hypothetical protein
MSSMASYGNPASHASMKIFLSSRVQRAVDEPFLGALVLVLSICAGSASIVSATAGCRVSDDFVPATSRIEETDAEMYRLHGRLVAFVMHEGRHLIGLQSFVSASLCLPVEIYSNASRWTLSDSIVRRPGTCGCCSVQQCESTRESLRFVE